jgi:hypothetical protein
LRRVDGSSVYTVAGANLYTSQRILAAEQRLLTTAGRRDGSAVDQTAVELALLEMAANGTALDVGQTALVRQMCRSGARVQQAIAPAGAGKTTAMRALTMAWTQDGGQVLGLAPSAAAAAVLAEQTGIRTDTVAKLTWSLRHGELPDWAATVGRSTLVIIDEAGMADTLSLDAAVQFAIDRGASVRLVGDDQQLAAIGAGGVLRDIQQTQGAVHLSELHRFTDPNEAAASLALRDGDSKSLEFYLRNGRVHVGDVATTTEDAFHAWVSDRAAGLDTIMIAPTRNLVAELNRRARAHRLDHSPASSEVSLADGNRASVGDVIITRVNDRRLGLGATDWVKNGDRWTITHIGKQGDLSVRHNRSHRTVRLPADYVYTSTGLGYATTIHAAQGVTADTMHGLLAGQESRQQLYTMLTRGRAANHLYLQVVGDGDPHTVIRPETVASRTPSELLEQILARDDARPPRPHCYENSATQRHGCLTPSSATPTAFMSRLSSSSDPRPSICSTPEPTWSSPNSSASPPGRLCASISWRWRLRPASTPCSSCRQPPPDANCTARGTWPPCWTGASQNWQLPTQGPFPGCPAFRQSCMIIRFWGEYLAKRSQLVTGLADQVRDQAGLGDTQPVWAPPGSHLTAAVIGEVAVWRAAVGIDPRDHRPTGPGQLQIASARWQQHLDRRITHPGDDPVSLDPRRGQVGPRIPQTRNREDRHHPWRPEARPTSPPPRSR